MLAFLLDGLHEDLNRVPEPKPSVAPVEGGGDDAGTASLSWANHLKRNSSKIVDLFHGQFKSTVCCPDCPKVSVTFDPFMYLSLPLPANGLRPCEVTLTRIDGAREKLGVFVERTASLVRVRERVRELSGLKTQVLLFMEVSGSTVTALVPSERRLSSLRDEDAMDLHW